MRMAQSQIQNVIIIDIDGLRRDLLYNTLAEDSLREPSKKNLPNLNRDHYRFEKRHRMKSTHGSFLASDSYVPLIFSTPYDPGLIRKRTSGDYSKGIIPTAKIADITPTILH